VTEEAVGLSDDALLMEFRVLKLRERAFLATLTPVQQAIYSLGGQPIGGWGPWPPLKDSLLDVLAQLKKDE
jgi:hypothetical protein